MTHVPMDDENLKNVLKAAIREVLEERREMLKDLVEEALEDIALGRAVEEGLHTPDATRSEVLSILEGRH